MSDSKRFAIILLIPVVVIVAVFSVIAGPKFIAKSSEDSAKFFIYEGIYSRVENPKIKELIKPILANECSYSKKYQDVAMSEAWVNSLLGSGLLVSEEIYRVQSELANKKFVSCATAYEILRDVSTRIIRTQEEEKNRDRFFNLGS